MEKRKRSKCGDGDGEFQFPEEVIQLIQSFLPGKQAARTGAVSKSWYNAWLTRPDVDLDGWKFNLGDDAFWNLTRKTIHRYESLNLKIKTLVLDFSGRSRAGFRELIAKVVNMGIEDVNVRCFDTEFCLLVQLLEAETIVKLTLSMWDGLRWPSAEPERVPFSNLKSLILKNVCIGLQNCCVAGDYLSLMFPCLEDFTISHCRAFEPMQISSTSLKCISLEFVEGLDFNFDVPNIRKFKFVGICLPSKLPNVYIMTVSTDWESDLSLQYKGRTYLDNSWPLSLKRFLNKFQGSKLSLGLLFDFGFGCSDNMENKDKQRFVLANLRLSLASPGYKFLRVPRNFEHFLVFLFGYCPPKFITLDYANDAFVEFMNDELIQDGKKTKIRKMFAKHGLGNVSLECFDATCAEWQPLSSKTWMRASWCQKCNLKIRYRLEWHGETAPLYPVFQSETNILNDEDSDSEPQSSPSQASSDQFAHPTNSTSEDGSNSTSKSHGLVQEEVPQIQLLPLEIPVDPPTNPTPIPATTGDHASDALIQEVQQ